jgi:hypothetical protein
VDFPKVGGEVAGLKVVVLRLDGNALASTL